MIKNLKKVISAVAALAISASAVSAFAVNFPDVAEDASYAQAVQELSSLDIISGFDDGTFRPDELVTRAQISKMIVDALNEGAQAEASKSNSQFQDVSTDHWAKGYINQGVADGFIAGYSDTEFGPDDNVTYVQAQKMLVSAIGYETFAQGNGGWPNGYKQWAANTGITSGVSGLVDDTQLTRAQVAQLIDNAMDAPVCVIKDWTPQWNGQQTPNLEVKDGEGKDYQTLFTKRHNAYKVYGRVTETSKTNSSIDNDQVEFRVEKADNFDDEYIKANSGDEITETMYFGDTNAENLVRTYAQALIQKDDDDEYTILSIAPAAASKSVTVFSEDVDESKTDLSKNVLYFYPAGTTRSAVKYELADSVDYYVNGVAMGTFDQDALETYILDNDSTIVTLQKETKTGSTSTDSKYNVILISSYGTAVVDQVVLKNDEVKVNFKEQSRGLKTSLTVETDEDSDKTYSITLNGEAIDPADLEENDVLTISYDEDAGFADSNFYDVIVSRDTAEGKFTGKNSAGDEFTIGGTKYKAAHGIDVESQLETSTEYTLYLDAFGRIAYVDEESQNKKLGILKRVYQKSNGDYIAEVITKSGTIEEYNVDDADAEEYIAIVKSTRQADVKTAYPQQVIDYKVSSTDKLTIKSVYGANEVTSEYKASSQKIGSIKLSDATVILDISNAADKKDDISVTSVDNLKDGTTYTAFGYDKSNSDSTSRFVIITEGIGGIDSTSQLAVFLESGTDTNADGDDVDTITVLYDEETVTFEIDDDSNVDVSDFEEGDLIVFSRNSSGEVDQLISIFRQYGVVNSAYDYADFRDDVFNGNITLTAGLDEELSDGDKDVNVYFGAVVNRSGSTYTIAPIIDGSYVNLAAGPDVTVDSATKVYTYNFDGKKKDFGRITSDDGIQVTPDVKAAYENGDKASDIYYLDNEDVVDEVVFAVVRTFDEDEAQEVYLIVAD